MLVPQLLNPIWQWVFESAQIAGLYHAEFAPVCTWTPPRRVMVDISREVPAINDAVRAGIMTLSEAIREQGYNPDDFLNEYAEDMKKLDSLGLVLSSDCRKDAERKASTYDNQQA